MDLSVTRPAEWLVAAKVAAEACAASDLGQSVVGGGALLHLWPPASVGPQWSGLLSGSIYTQ